MQCCTPPQRPWHHVASHHLVREFILENMGVCGVSGRSGSAQGGGTPLPAPAQAGSSPWLPAVAAQGLGLCNAPCTHEAPQAAQNALLVRCVFRVQRPPLPPRGVRVQLAHQLLVAVPQHAGVEPYPRLSPHALGGAEAGGGGPAGSHERRLHIHRLPRQRFQPRHHPRRLVDFFIFRDDGGGPLMDGGAASGSSILQPLGASCGTPPRGEAGILVAGQVP
mmetsp:Transcript_3574/g.10385  ORF Transcript_3574/g.10385 Transcript_3574/m.10385 type:complete len:221 (-) Transcript_3574:701-1363(-)